jgi:hypothetical protein
MLLQEKNLESYLQRGMHIDITEPTETVSDKRREPRYPVSKVSIVHPVHPVERLRLHAYVMDLSSSGMKLRVERPLDPCTQVQVLLEDVIIFGEVRHCTESEGRYNVGVLVLDVLSPPKRKRR